MSHCSLLLDSLLLYKLSDSVLMSRLVLQTDVKTVGSAGMSAKRNLKYFWKFDSEQNKICSRRSEKEI